MAAKSKILLRGDGNTKIGMGHMYRLLALADMLKDSFDILFLTQESSVTIPITEAGVKLKFISESVQFKDEPLFIKENYSKYSILILDGYNFNRSYQKKLKENGFKLVYIDDLAQEEMFADIIVNHSPAAKPENYQVQTYTKFALGLDFAILRSVFLKASQTTRMKKNNGNAFVSFGGADPKDFTFFVSKMLLKFSMINTLYVVLGHSYSHNSIYELAKKHPRLEIYKNVDETKMFQIMQNSDLAIVPSSNILFEVLAVKMMVLSGYYVENQKNIYFDFLDKKVIYPLENLNNLNSEDLLISINNCLNTQTKMIENQKTLYPRNIKENYLKLIHALC